MWEYSSESKKWVKRVEKLDKRMYNYLRQEIEDVRFYSKCLDGIGYIPVSDLNNVYDVLNHKTNDTHKIDKNYSYNFNGTTTPNGISLERGDLSTKGTHTRYNAEYGYTLKNLFTPSRLIEDSTNYLTVDVATTESINIYKTHLEIDGITLKEGHRILVKDNVTNINLNDSIDPESYFNHNYWVTEKVGNMITYAYYNEENGIYKFENSKLVRENDLDEYDSAIRYSTHIKLGSNNHMQYFLSRMKNGNFPLVSNNDPIEFIIKSNYIVRNSLEYKNTLDNEFHAGIIQQSESITYMDKVYQIPERFVSVGDFGFIVNNQDGYSNIINNKFKENINDISKSLYDKYLLVGDNGTLLSMNKIDLEISYIEIDTFEKFNSIQFVNNSRGIIVGNNGTILITNDQLKWEKLTNDMDNNLNKIHFRNISNAVITGDNGIVRKLKLHSDNSNSLSELELKRKTNLFDERDIRNDIHDVGEFEISRESLMYDGADWVDLTKNIGSSNFSIDFRFKSTDIGTSISTLFSFLTSKYPNTTGSTVDKGIKVTIEPDLNGVHRIILYITDGNKVNTLQGNINIENGIWYHILLTRNRGTYKLYINQVLSDETNSGFSGNFDNFNNRIRLGAELTYNDTNPISYSTTSFNHFKGVIDQVRLFDKELDESEVIEFSNNYLSDLTGLISWYKFNSFKASINSISKKINTSDIISSTPLIIESNSNLNKYNNDNRIKDGIDTEYFRGIIIPAEDSISIVLDIPDNYSEQEMNNQLFIDTDELEIRKIIYNKFDRSIYAMGKKGLFKIDSDNLDFDLFNQINIQNVDVEEILSTSYNNITLSENGNMIYLVSGTDNQIDSIDLNKLCSISAHDPLEDCTGVYATVSVINSTNGIIIENDYRNDITDVNNINSIEYKKTLGYLESATQSILHIPIDVSGSPIPMYKELYCSFNMSNIINGHFEFSMDGYNFIRISENGDHLIPLTVGSSILTIRAILDTESPIGNKIRGLITNIIFYEKECVKLDSSMKYNGGRNTQKVYFSQFDTQSQLNKLNNGELYSYIDIKSLRVDGVEQIDFGAYSSLGFPKYLYPSDFDTEASVRCGIGTMCDYISYLPNPVMDRIRYGFGLEVNGYEYTYATGSYGLLEGLSPNSIQSFGIDTPSIVNSTYTLSNPFFVGIDFTKSFRFEVDSMILDNSDLVFSDITNGNSSIVSPLVSISAATISYGTASGTYFNQIEFTDPVTYNISSYEFEPNKLYYLELELNGDISITIGDQVITLSGTGNITKHEFKIDFDNIGVDVITITSISNMSTIYNFVLTDRFPTKSVIQWDPSTCTKSYTLNGVSEEGTGFLQKGIIGEYNPSCVIDYVCNNESILEEIVGIDYWNNFTSKLLFLNYDIASKLYFFDVNTGEYQLPYPATLYDISILDIKSLNGQKSWIDYDKDTSKDFIYLGNGNKNNANVVKYSTKFNKVNLPKYFKLSNVILNGNSTNNIIDINGSSTGLLPHLDNVNIGQPPTSFNYFFYDNFMVIKTNSNFMVDLGDIIHIKNALISDNLMVIYIFTNGSDKYIYLRTSFNQGLTNRLISWNKSTTITNLNKFGNLGELLHNFNLHPISVGYNIVDDIGGGKVSLVPNFNFRTAYFNLQCDAQVTNDILNIKSNKMIYKNKVLSFGYSARYNILDYLSKNPIFNQDYKLDILPSYKFKNDNTEVLYTVSTGLLSFNSNLKSEWESIPKYVFLDLNFDSSNLSQILTLNKYYDSESDRYIIETYNYLGHVYNQTDIDNGINWNLRVRNTLGEISEDLQNLNNIQRSTSKSYHITDLGNKLSTTYETLKSDLNFKPFTDSYARAFLNQKEIKEYLSGIVYTDYKNELAVNIINLPMYSTNKITGLSKYDSNCEDCIYEDYVLFNNFNQFTIINGSPNYTNRIPFKSYGFHNNIYFKEVNTGTSVDVPIHFVPESGTDRVIEFIINKLVDATISIMKGGNILHTINYIPSSVERTKILFTDDGLDDLIMRFDNIQGTNEVNITNIRVGNNECVDNCYLTKLHIKSHGLLIGDGIVIDMHETIYNLDNIYESKFNANPSSDWVIKDDYVSNSVVISNSIIDLDIQNDSIVYMSNGFNVTEGDLYRLTFDYHMTKISGTPSLSPSFGSDVNAINNEFETLYANGGYDHVVVNFTPTDNIMYIGFNVDVVGECNLKINSISIDKIEDVGEYYDGYRVVQEVINENEIVINTEYNGAMEELSATYSYINRCGDSMIGVEIISDLGSMTKSTFDPYLNYTPIDIFELGKDDKIKQSIEIKPNDWVENHDNTVSILDTIDMSNYRFRLVDGLSIVDLNDKYPWLLEAEIRNAIIGRDNNGVVWYKGIWDCGRWFGGTWYSGDWRDGEWYDGIWNNSDVQDNIIKASVKVLDSSILQSVWHNGNFRNGTWYGGKFRNGNFRNGTWNTGHWVGGVWHGGTWNDGTFERGTWIRGTWNNGIFNCRLGLSSWFDGIWNDGDFKCGTWYGGRFNSTKSISKFGGGATLTFPAIWENGQFINGHFGVDNNRHDLSIWKTGYWWNGTWDNGTAHQITWNNGLWKDGVVKDIDVVAFYGDVDGIYYFTLRGDWKFKKGDSLWIINNDTYSPIYGSDDVIGQYKVDKDYISINEGEYTKVLINKIPNTILTLINNDGQKFADGYLNSDIPTDSTIKGDTITKLVSHFSKTDWLNGQLKNGIFDGTFFKNGMWEKGVFKSGKFGY